MFPFQVIVCLEIVDFSLFFSAFCPLLKEHPLLEKVGRLCSLSYIIYINKLNWNCLFNRAKGRSILAEFLINDFRFWCEVECYRNQAEAVHQSGNVGHYSAQDEENLHLKAQLICDQFLNSPILPRCRINIQPEISATIIENVKLGMFDLSLFHDCTINIFPLLLNYWKTFCLRRHKYIPRSEISNFKVNSNFFTFFSMDVKYNINNTY